MGLDQQGFRFIRTANAEYVWRHPLEIPAGSEDCTDMTDAQFERFVFARGDA